MTKLILKVIRHRSKGLRVNKETPQEIKSERVIGRAGVSADHILRHARLDGFLAVPRSRAYSCRIVITQCNELCVTQVVVGCPFEEFKTPYKEGPEPDAVFQLL
jgi:hypothetical protein